MMKKLLIAAAVAGLTFAAFGIDNKLKLSEYVISTPKVEKNVNLVFLSDFHSMKLKDGGKNLFKIIDSAKPDCILLGGDIFNRKGNDADFDYTVDFIKNLKSKYDTCCFVTGNHEFTLKRKDQIKGILKEIGVKLVGEESFVFTSQNSQKLLIGGTDFNSWEEEIQMFENADFSTLCERTELFSVLLRHVPFVADSDKHTDLILSGHNHGGLWRIPNTSIGAAGGGGYIFPKYTHGEYKKGNTRLIVGSGITTETYFITRLYNPPEVVSISIIPEK